MREYEEFFDCSTMFSKQNKLPKNNSGVVITRNKKGSFYVSKVKVLEKNEIKKIDFIEESTL